jgi:hypothetical protein
MLKELGKLLARASRCDVHGPRPLQTREPCVLAVTSSSSRISSMVAPRALRPNRLSISCNKSIARNGFASTSSATSPFAKLR